MHDYSNISVVTACDPKYVKKLYYTIPSWIYVKKMDCPIVVFVHGMDLKDKRLDQLRAYKNVRFVSWDLPGAETQRERMLASFIIGAAEHVETDYMVKFDAETVALDDSPWLKDEFFDFDMVGQKWGYTKPGHWVSKIDYWIDGLNKIGRVENFKGPRKRYRIIGDPDNFRKTKYKERRVCSWIRLTKTSLIQEIAKNVDLGRLIVPSEDTLVWRWCERLDKKWARHNFKGSGWVHSKKGFVELSTKAIEQYGQTDNNPSTSEADATATVE